MYFYCWICWLTGSFITIIPVFSLKLPPIYSPNNSINISWVPIRGTEINLIFSIKAQTVGREGKSWLRVESISFGELEENTLNKCLHHLCSMPIWYSCIFSISFWSLKSKGPQMKTNPFVFWHYISQGFPEKQKEQDVCVCMCVYMYIHIGMYVYVCVCIYLSFYLFIIYLYLSIYLYM